VQVERNGQWIPLEGEPQVGDRVKGTDISKKSTWLYRYVGCPDCGHTRWVTTGYASRTHDRCQKCAGLLRRVKRSPEPVPEVEGAKQLNLLAADPKVGDRAMGREIGKNPADQRFEYVQCPDCRQTRWVTVYSMKHAKSGGRCMRCASQLNMTKYNKGGGSNSPLWKGGRTVAKSGYVRMTVYPDDPLVEMAFLNVDDGTYHVLEHRYVMAKHLGRCLERGEIVHHVNGNRSDNRIENLRLYSHEAHGTRTDLETEVQALKAKVAQMEAGLLEARRFADSPAIKEDMDGAR
jgi:ribosomal protein S27E